MDPGSLNAATIPMIWEVPKVRSLLQDKLVGCSWFAKFDFIAMFWQLALHEDSRHLFSFYAGRFGSFCFNRVAMGALNSSIYTQKMLTRMFANTLFRGKPILENGLFVQTDDVLLYATSAEELLELIVIFLRVVMMHNLAIHPDKCLLFARSLIYWDFASQVPVYRLTQTGFKPCLTCPTRSPSATFGDSRHRSVGFALIYHCWQSQRQR